MFSVIGPKPLGFGPKPVVSYDDASNRTNADSALALHLER